MRRASTALVRALASRHAVGVAATAGTQLPAAHALRAVGSAATSTTGVLSRTWEWQNGPSVRGFAAKTTDDEVEQFLEDLEDDEDEAWHVEPPNYAPPMAAVGSKAPLFTTKAVVDGEFKTVSLSDYRGKYCVLFFYPKDFTFVCPTEIIAFSDRAKEFEALGAQLLACSTDTEETHLAWIKTPRNKGGLGYMQIPILADTTKAISASYGVLLEKAGVALRGLFIINPQGVIQQITINDLPIGRSVDETLRLLQAIQFNAEHGEVCPADWKPGGKSMIADPEKSLEYFSSMSETGSSGSEEAGSSLRSIESRKDFDSLVRSSKPTVVDFMAPWCGKCRMIAPFVEELAQKHPELSFAKFDTTAEPLEGLSAELGVKALPVFKFFKDGKEVAEQVIGYKKKPLEEAVNKLAAASK